MRLRTVVFLICVASSFALCHLVARTVLPPSWHGSRYNLEKDDWFLSTYGDFGLDYYILRFGLLGVGEHVKKADIICSSSSKGLFGFDAELLANQLSTPEHPVRVYNISYGFGEGVGYLMETIKSLDLHDQILIADLTDSTRDYAFSNMGQLGRKTASWLDAYKIVLEKMLTYRRDLCFQDRLPKIFYTSEDGFRVTPHVITARNIRAKRNGNIQHTIARQPQEPWIGTWTFPYKFERLREPFLEECRRRNIRIIFTSIPTQGYDPAWGSRVAKKLGLPHVTVDPHGIELVDHCHMSSKGRHLFSSRLAAALLANQETAAMIHGGRSPGSPSTDNSNTTSFR